MYHKAHFEISKYNLAAFEDNDLDYEEDTIIEKFCLRVNQELL
jgi:hypothetical protein